MAARTGKLRRFQWVLPLLAFLIPASARAQPAFQVKDLNTTQTNVPLPLPLGSVPDSDTVILGGIVFLAASDGIHGRELWRTDGTEAGTRLVADICPGSCTSHARSFTATGNVFFFLANDGLHGFELWKSDGTTAGTVLVKDLIPQEQAFPALQILGGLDGVLFFSYHQDLWRSDGTAAGTFLVKDFEEGNGGDPLKLLGRLDGKLLFFANDTTHSSALWVTDGTSTGTVLLKDISPGSGSSALGHQGAVIGGKVLFSASGPEGFELWASDGTGPGTVLVKDISPGVSSSSPRSLTAFGGEVFFFTTSGLWKSDGTGAGTVPVHLFPFTSSSITLVGNRFFFFIDCALWTSNGTGPGTGLVRDFNSGECGHPRALVESGAEEFWFVANDFVHGYEPWKSDGTLAGTSLIADIEPGTDSSSPGPAVFAGGRGYFQADRDQWVDRQLWTSDGTAAGMRMLQINHQSSGFALQDSGQLYGPRAFLDFDGTLLFQGNITELWRTDGTPEGTSRVKDLSSPLPGELTRAGDTLFFRTGAGSLVESLWKTDGTSAGTVRLYQFQYLHSLGSFGPRNLAALGDNLLFIGAWVNELAIDLMKSDGTRAGTTRVTPSSEPPYWVSSLVSNGNMVFFQDIFTDLWKSDGTQPGTVFLGSVLNPERDLENVSAHRDGVLLFAGSAPESGEELWRSDGTAAGTYLFAETIPGPASKPLGPFATAGTNLFFVAARHELWKNDAAGTSLVRALPGDDLVGVRSLTALGEKVYFTYDDGAHGHELWVSDGIEAGTRMVEDILPGPGSSHPRNLRVEGSILVFSATDGVHGVEPWRSDGTVLGTRMFQDIAPGALSSSPVEFTASGSNLYFAANNGTAGFELWALPRPALLATFADVPASFWAWQSIETLAAIGITKGCTPDRFCPEQTLSRAEAAVFLLRAIHGANYVPPPGTGTRFTDVPASFWAVDWIEQFATEGITSGCGVNLFCPLSSVSRAELAVFLLRSKHGGSYQPPAATGTRFTDVPASYWAAAWIEQLANEGITTGCAPNQFCPDRAVTRAEMAALMVKAFFPQAPPPAP